MIYGELADIKSGSEKGSHNGSILTLHSETVCKLIDKGSDEINMLKQEGRELLHI